MKSYTLFALMLFFIACSSENNSRQIKLFNGINIPLIENEKVVDISAENQTEYSSYFSEHSFQIPVFKYIEGKDYKLFIGLPVGAQLTDLNESSLIRNDEILDSKTDSTTFYYKSHKANKKFIVDYLANYEGNLVYFLFTTENADVSDSLFNYSSLRERMKQNEY